MKSKSSAAALCVILALTITGCSTRQKSNIDDVKSETQNALHLSTSKANERSTGISKLDQELTFKRDLNKDDAEEIIKVTFNYDSQSSGTNEKAQNYTILITSGSKQYSYESNGVNNVIPAVHFADFDINDNYIEFYINSEGPSDDPSSAIYRFDKNGIKKLRDTSGYITEYDGEGKIYTNFSKTSDKHSVVLSYYDIRKGSLSFVDKRNLMGRKLQFDNSLILFTDSADENGYCKSYVDDNQGAEGINKVLASYDKDSIVKLSKPNEELKIVDIDNTYHGMFKEGRPRNIRIKVKAPDGKEGWLDWLNGGD